MSAVAFTKLFSTITESTLWVEQPHHVRIVWITMLAMSDRDGYVAASVPGLAARARVTVAEAEEALQVFLSPDRYSRTPDYEGRRIRESMGGWELLNHAKYRRAQSEDSERERKRQWAEENRKRIADKRAAAAAAASVSESPRIATVAKSSKVASASASPSGSDLDLDPEGDGGNPDSALPEPEPPRAVPSRKLAWFAPPDFAPTDAHRTRCAELRLDVGELVRAFRLHEFNREYSDWNRRFSRWIEDEKVRRETELGKARTSKFGPPAASNALKGGGLWESTGVHRKFALAKGLDPLEYAALAQKYRAGEDWHDRTRRDADERFGTLLGKAAREKARGK